MRRICSKKSDLLANVRKLKDWLSTIIKEKKRALESPSFGCSKTSERSVSGNYGTRVLLVVHYKPILCRLGQVIRKNLCFLYQDEEFKRVFNPVPFVLFRSVRTLRSHLVRAKVYPIGEELLGQGNVTKIVAKFAIPKTETFQSFVDK